MKIKIAIDTTNVEHSFDPGFEIPEEEYVSMLRNYSANIGNDSYRFSYKGRKDFGSRVDKGEDPYVRYIYVDGSIANPEEEKGNSEAFTEMDLMELSRSGEMSVAIVGWQSRQDENFDGEIRAWMTDSAKVLGDEAIDRDEIHRFLPPRTLLCSVNGREYVLEGCRIYGQYSFSELALIINRIKIKK